jgi:hypothetical protein
VDRLEDMLRACLRAVDALNRRAEGCEPFQAMMRRTVLSNAALKEKLAAIEKERAEAEGVQ